MNVYLRVDASANAYFQHEDGTINDNSAVLTKELHLTAGQTVDIGVGGAATGVYASYNGIFGYETWFCGHLIIPD